MSDLVTDIQRGLRKLLTGASVVTASLYVLGFIFLKTYLAVFGFQIELSSLSLPNLLLAHRFFVAQHFFVLAGFFQALIFSNATRPASKTSYLLAALLLTSPLIVLALGYAGSSWSEPNTPPGFDPGVTHLWLPLVAGWVGGALLLLCYRWVAGDSRPLLGLERASKSLALVLAMAAVVASYRGYAWVLASSRQQTHALQLLIPLDPMLPMACGVVYVDSSDFFLLCGSDRLVIHRDDLKRYRVIPFHLGDPPPNPSLQRTAPEHSPGHQHPLEGSCQRPTLLPTGSVSLPGAAGRCTTSSSRGLRAPVVSVLWVRRIRTSHPSKSRRAEPVPAQPPARVLVPPENLRFQVVSKHEGTAQTEDEHYTTGAAEAPMTQKPHFNRVV